MSTMKENQYIGKWQITEMEMWDQDYVNEIAEGHFTFEKDGIGHFQFGLVEGGIDFRVEKFGDFERLDFSWEGLDENDPCIGRGYASLKSDGLVERIYFHMGDESWFRAKKMEIRHSDDHM